MNSIFRTAFYLRSNYVNKEGKTPIMIRIYLNGERMSIGSSGLSIDMTLWDNNKERLKGRCTEILTTNLQLDNIQCSLQNIFRKLETIDQLSLERIKSEYLGNYNEIDSVISLFEKYNNDIREQIGISITKGTFNRYKTCEKHLIAFLKNKYGRTDLKLTELTYLMIHDFSLYLRTIAGLGNNSATKTLKTFKTIVIFGQKIGALHHDPFAKVHFHFEPVDRGYLTDEELLRIANKEFELPRLELVRDIFIFSCFTGLAYIDISNLTLDNIITINEKDWIITKRQKTKVESNILLLDIPRKIIEKHKPNPKRNGKLLPMLSNQKCNSYLKEIADLCGVKKNLTFHMARHTFATMSLSKGVPMESVSKMLGHTNIKTTQIYARITNKKIEHDMEQLAGKLGKFNDAMGI